MRGLGWFVSARLVVSACSGEVSVMTDSGAVTNSDSADAGSSSVADAGMTSELRDGGAVSSADAGMISTATDAGPVGSPCGPEDPERIFFNDFEEGVFLAGSGVTHDPAHHFDLRGAYSSASNYAIVGSGATPDARTPHVLRGNFWEWLDPTASPRVQAVDPVAADGGVTIEGTKSPGLAVNLGALGVTQMPPGNPDGPVVGRGEFYLSFWLWYDEDFTHMADTGDEQGVKLFYAFGPNSIQWVLSEWGSTSLHFQVNLNNLGGAWPRYPWDGGFTPLNGRWTHVEWYFRGESAPVFYEYGNFSGGGMLASACPGAADYNIQFPVVGSSPQECSSPSEAYAANSKDGVFIVRLDGETIIDHRNMAWNGRFNRINFPAWHGGGGQAVASAGWAIDDVCIRSTAPAGLLD